MPDPYRPDPRAYAVISPCRNEAQYMRRTLDSMVAQTVQPTLWVIVDDGSTDETPQILAEYAGQHDWITVIQKPDRGHRAVGPGVIEAFYAGYDTIEPADYTYVCKLDLDLDLPPRYFEGLMDRMEANPRIGTASGQPWFTGKNGQRVSERCGPEMSVGMTKFYRTDCFEQIGGFVREVMWDGLDCHKARMMGWIAISYPDEELAFEHLRPMGSSQQSIYTGRRRHGAGQWYMGSDPVYFAATAAHKMTHPPYVLGGLASLQGYLGAWLSGKKQHDDKALVDFIRRYQREALTKGKSAAIKRIEDERASAFSPPTKASA